MSKLQLIKEATKDYHTIHMICDDRLIAALYTACHYPGSNSQDAEPIVVMHGNMLFNIAWKP